jgi:hypothetical protein
MSIKILAVSGVARSGKDTFTSILINRLRERGKTAKQIALAAPLKGLCDEFTKANLGISAYTQVPEEKMMIRPFLVWFGDAKRKQTNGRFWVELANKSIQQSEVEGIDYAIISDIRYDHYERDELSWLKKEHNGVLAHISRYEMRRPVTMKVSNPKIEKIFVPPANDHEMLNDPRVKRMADYIVEWPTIYNCSSEELVVRPEMISYVDKFIEKFSL